MFLPAWVVAITSFLRATSDLQAPLDDGLASLTAGDSYDKIWRFFPNNYRGNVWLGVSEAKAGAHVKLRAASSLR